MRYLGNGVFISQTGIPRHGVTGKYPVLWDWIGLPRPKESGLLTRGCMSGLHPNACAFGCVRDIKMLFFMYFTYKLPFSVPTVCPNYSPAPLSHVFTVFSKVINSKLVPFFLNILPHLLIRFWKSFLNTVLKQPPNVLNWIKIWRICWPPHLYNFKSLLCLSCRN
jgi:hypothetical protein